MKPLYFLGIDQSLNHTGAVILTADGEVIYAEEWKLSSKKKYPSEVHKFTELYTRAERLCAYSPVIAVLEDYSYGSTSNKYTLGGARASVCIPLLRNQVPHFYVAPNSRAKFGTGSGSANKAQVIKGVKTHFGFTTDNDNIADALILAHIGRGVMGHFKSSKRYQLEVIHSVKGRAEQALKLCPPVDKKE